MFYIVLKFYDKFSEWETICSQERGIALHNCLGEGGGRRIRAQTVKNFFYQTAIWPKFHWVQNFIAKNPLVKKKPENHFMKFRQG